MTKYDIVRIYSECMKAIIKISNFMFVLLLTSVSSYGNTYKPDWVFSKPTNNENFHYFVGVGEAESLSEAKSQAEHDAKIQVIDMVLGLTTTVRQKISSDTESVFVEGSIISESDIIQVKGIQTESSFIAQNMAGKYQVFLLRKISNQNIRELKQMQSNQQGENIKFSTIYIHADQSDVKVYLNNEYKGSTPMQLNLDKGSFDIKLEKIGFETIHKKIFIENYENQKIFVSMEQKLGYIRFISLIPADAVLIVEDFDNFNKRDNVYSFPEGKYKIKISKEGYQDYVDDVDILSNRYLNLDIKLKPLLKSKEDLEVTINNYLESKEFGKVIDIINFSSDNFKNNPQFNLYMAIAYHELGSYKASLNTLKKSETIKKVNPQYYIYKCLNEYKNVEYRLAIKSCEEGLEYFPSNAVLYLTLARTYKELNRGLRTYARQTENAYRSAVKLNDDYKAELIGFCKYLENNYYTELCLYK